jgi:hypothetical protein
LGRRRRKSLAEKSQATGTEVECLRSFSEPIPIFVGPAIIWWPSFIPPVASVKILLFLLAPNRKMAKDRYRLFTAKEFQMSFEHMKR